MDLSSFQKFMNRDNFLEFFQKLYGLIQSRNQYNNNKMESSQCPPRYMLDQHGQCVHYLFPPSFMTIIGTILIPTITGLSSLAGLGGGGPSLVVFIMFFNYLPKDANIIVFTSILGATLGNCFNQMTKAHNGSPIVRYKYAFVTLPIMFIGSYFGVYLNSFLPSAVICAIIVIQSSTSLPKIKKRFKESYDKETKEILLHRENNLQNKELITEERINPFMNDENVFIFKNLFLLMATFTLLLILRGTQKMPSLIGIERCSFMYWFMLLISLCVVGLFAYKNYNTLKSWQTPKDLQLKNMQSVDGLQQVHYEDTISATSQFQKNLKDIIYYGIMAGVFSGFGLGGGLFLVPLFRGLGCQPLQATATTSFTIVITATINCIQGILLGVIRLEDFTYFIVVAGGGSFLISVMVSGYLRKIHRLSYVEYLLYILLVLAVINIPISLFMKYVNSGYDASLIFSFGNSC